MHAKLPRTRKNTKEKEKTLANHDLWKTLFASKTEAETNREKEKKNQEQVLIRQSK
jgi:hypothetical protein